MKIGDKSIGEGRTYIIADVGSNFNGSLELAKEYYKSRKRDMTLIVLNFNRSLQILC